jgi:uncharacterized protein YegP (UPF0339 family)
MTDPQPRGLRFELYRNLKGDHYFRIVAGNGETIAQSEGYKHRADCEHTVKLIQAKAPIAQVVDLTATMD